MNRHLSNWMLAATAVLAGVLALSPAARGCPGCQATGLTFTEEMSSMDVVIIARLIELAPPAAAEARGGGIPKAKFEVVQVLKGDSLIHVRDKVETLLLGGGAKGSPFLIMGINPPKVMWSTPLALTERAIDYLTKATRLPKDGAERYAFFQDYLEDEDILLSRDAYDEFAKASYTTVRTLKDHMRHDQLVAWIKNPDVPASRRRLYFVMLGVCGSEQDLSMLEELIDSADREQRRGLDMLIFSFLSIRGQPGLSKVEDKFLRNKKSDYADTYAAIMALRFHASEGIILKPDQVVPSLRLLLERPDLADLVIPDLARWQDWTAMDQLFDLYKNADEKSSWVRVPVVNYLRACPLAKAKELLKECEQIDPQSVKRANTFSPVVPAVSPAPAPATTSQFQVPGQAPRFVSTGGDAVPVAYAAPIPEPVKESGEVTPAAAGEKTAAPPGSAPAGRRAETKVASVNPGVSPAKALRSSPAFRPNLWQLLGVPILAGAVLWLLQSSILRGRLGRG